MKNSLMKELDEKVKKPFIEILEREKGNGEISKVLFSVRLVPSIDRGYRKDDAEIYICFGIGFYYEDCKLLSSCLERTFKEEMKKIIFQSGDFLLNLLGLSKENLDKNLELIIYESSYDDIYDLGFLTLNFRLRNNILTEEEKKELNESFKELETH